MRSASRFTAWIMLIAPLSGCAGGGAGPLGLGAVVGDRNLASAEPLFSDAEERCLDRADQLLSLIYGPDVRSDDADGASARSRSASFAGAGCVQLRKTLRYVLGSGDGVPNATPRYDALKRNEIMDALIATSNRKCTRYVALLKNADGAVNASLSLGAIITGGLGSFIGGAGTAKALAGTASILSGSRAAINESYLSNQTIQVLAAAFEKARRDQRRVITNRQACTERDYTLMRGIEDALAYHQSCSLVAGLAETARSIERSENPGLDAMRTQFAELANLRRQAAELTGNGSITPVAAAPAERSLGTLIAADQILTTAQATLKQAMAAEDAAKAQVNAAKASLPAGALTSAAVQQTGSVLQKATVDRLNAEQARNEAARIRDAEIAALARVSPLSAAAVEPETRVCPYRADRATS